MSKRKQRLRRKQKMEAEAEAEAEAEVEVEDRKIKVRNEVHEEKGAIWIWLSKKETKQITPQAGSLRALPTPIL